jgi:hypothetical protein
MFRFKPTSQFVEEYHNIVSWALNIEDLIKKKSVNSVSNKEIYILFTVYFTKKLTDF